MTFEFTYDGKTYDVALTNRLIIQVEEACGKPIQHLWHTHRGQDQLMLKTKMAIYSVILGNLAISHNDAALALSVNQFINRDDVHWNSAEVVENCSNFIETYIKQQVEFLKIKGKDKDKVKEDDGTKKK